MAVIVLRHAAAILSVLSDVQQVQQIRNLSAHQTAQSVFKEATETDSL